MAVHMRYNSCHISLPSSAKQQLESNSALCGEFELQRPIFWNSYFKFIAISSRFSFVIVLIVTNKAEMTLKVSRD